MICLPNPNYSLLFHASQLQIHVRTTESQFRIEDDARTEQRRGKRIAAAEARTVGTTTENASMSATTSVSTSAITVAQTGTPAGMHSEQDSITDGPNDGNAGVRTTSDQSTSATNFAQTETTVDNATKQSTSATNVAQTGIDGANMDSDQGSIPRGCSKRAAAKAQASTTEPEIVPTIEEDDTAMTDEHSTSTAQHNRA